MPLKSGGLAALLLCAQAAHAADCAACRPLLDQHAALSKASADLTALVAANKAALAALSENDISKRVKISSNLLILTTRNEKSINERVLVDQAINQRGCQPCLK